MALIYALLRVVAFALTKLAARKHHRAKSRLEQADNTFREIETACKAEEVQLGRPANFASQFKLMKLFDVRDRANSRWQKAAIRWIRRKRLSSWLAGANGRKLPYAVGLFDMLAGLHLWQLLQQSQFDWSGVADLLSRLG